MIGYHYDDKPLRPFAVNDLLEKVLHHCMALIINRIQPPTLVFSQAEVVHEKCPPILEYLGRLLLITACT